MNGEEEHISYLINSGVTKAEMARIYSVHWSTINRFIKSRMQDYLAKPANNIMV